MQIDDAVEQLRRRPTRTIGPAGRAVHANPCRRWRDALGYEALVQVRAHASDAHEEGVAAFLEDRESEFERRAWRAEGAPLPSPAVASTTDLPELVVVFVAMSVSFTDDDVGKRVVNANGDEIGIVSAIEHGSARVEPDPGMTDTIKAKLGWEDADEKSYPLQEQAIDRVTDDEIRLKGDLSGVGGTTGTDTGL